MTRRVFLAACLLPSAVTVSATPHIIDTGLVAQWYGDPRLTGFLVLLAASASALPWIPTVIYRVWQINPDGPLIQLYLVR